MPSSDATEPVQQDRSRAHERDRFVAFAFAGAHLLLETDGAGRIVFAAGTRCGLTTGTVESLVGVSVHDLAVVEEQAYLRRLMLRLAERGRLDPALLVLRACDGRPFAVRLGGCRLPGYPDSNFLAITVTSEAHQRLRIDRMPDITRFVSELEAKIDSGRALERDQNLSLVLIDGLSRYVGDAPADRSDMVRALESYLLSMSSDGEAAARIEEDRYAVLHDSGVTMDELGHDLDHLLGSFGADALRESLHLKNVPINAAGLPPADVARALAFTLQRLCGDGAGADVGTVEASIASLLRSSVERVSSVRRTLEERDFRMVYQPIVRLAGGTTHHMEALMRVGRAETPAEFIGFAERVGLMGELDLLVFQTVLDALKEAPANGRPLPDVAVNMSANSLGSTLVFQQLERVLEPYGDLCRKLLVEITETALVTDFSGLQATIDRLRGRGIRVCLDDVGAGTTSFMSLNALKVDFVKIDGDLVRKAAAGGRERTVLTSIVQIAHQLGMVTIGEMVETEEQAAFLRAHGVRLAQGYLFGRPGSDLDPPQPPAAPPPARRPVPARRPGQAEVWR